MHKILSYIIAIISFLLCLTVPSLSQAYEVNEDEEFEGLYDPFNDPDDPIYETVPPDLDLESNFYKPGFHAAFGLGYQYVPKDSVSSGYHYFEAQSQGGFLSLDIGYHWDFFALSFNMTPRAAWLMNDAKVRGHRLNYVALNEGDWDGYFLSLGIRADFFAPLREIMFMKFGFMIDFPVGIAPSIHTRSEYQVRFGMELGLYWRLNDQLALGFNAAIRGRLRNSTPWTIDLNSIESKRTTYFEPSIGLIYHP